MGSSVLFTEFDRRLSVSNTTKTKESTRRGREMQEKIDEEKNKDILTKGQ